MRFTIVAIIAIFALAGTVRAQGGNNGDLDLEGLDLGGLLEGLDLPDDADLGDLDLGDLGGSFEGLEDLDLGTIFEGLFNDTDALEDLEECSTKLEALQPQADACSTVSETNICPDECKSFLNEFYGACADYFANFITPEDISGYDQVCGTDLAGIISGAEKPTQVPSAGVSPTPAVSPTPTPTPVPSVIIPTVPNPVPAVVTPPVLAPVVAAPVPAPAPTIVVSTVPSPQPAAVVPTPAATPPATSGTSSIKGAMFATVVMVVALVL